LKDNYDIINIFFFFPQPFSAHVTEVRERLRRLFWFRRWVQESKRLWFGSTHRHQGVQSFLSVVQKFLFEWKFLIIMMTFLIWQNSLLWYYKRQIGSVDPCHRRPSGSIMSDVNSQCRLCSAKVKEDGLSIFGDRGKESFLESKIKLYLHFSVRWILQLFKILVVRQYRTR